MFTRSSFRDFRGSAAAVWLVVPWLLASSCGDSSPQATLDEVYDQGLTLYVGAFPPDNEVPLEGGVTRFEFDVPEDPTVEPRGPLCLRGTLFSVETRPGNSDELFIWLQEGGACWGDFCAATEETSDIFDDGILDPAVPNNPLGEHDLVYVPYCDGSLFAGDVDRPLPPSIVDPSTVGDTLSFQRGLQNLTAALDIAKAQFPNPTRVVLAGSSGGSFGTITATPLVRFYYPDVDIMVISDSGIGIVRDGEPEFLEGLLTGWNALQLIPESCADCIADGNTTGFIRWNLENDPNVFMAPITHVRDAIIGGFFLRLEPEEYERAVLRETDALAADFPDRYRRYLQPGENHSVMLNAGPVVPFLTSMLGSLLEEDIEGVTPLSWITAAVEQSEAWQDTVDPSIR
ncbi:MAG: pectin acetylesterase-family hydrolase [Myxococcota bacterium]